MTFAKKMKILVLLTTALAIAGCSSPSKSKEDVDAAAKTQDPAKLSLEAGGIPYGKRIILPSRIEAGILTLGDGEQVKYWFKSHHLGDDLGCTRFEYSDGSVDYLEGRFCCEVLLPDPRIADRNGLRKFIADNDGILP